MFFFHVGFSIEENEITSLSLFKTAVQKTVKNRFQLLHLVEDFVLVVIRFVQSAERVFFLFRRKPETVCTYHLPRCIKYQLLSKSTSQRSDCSIQQSSYNLLNPDSIHFDYYDYYVRRQRIQRINL